MRADASGVEAGDRIAVLSHDAIEVPETFFAATKIGAIRVGINPRLAAREIVALIDDAEPKLVFYAAEHQRMIDLIGPDLDKLRAPPRLISFSGK